VRDFSKDAGIPAKFLAALLVFFTGCAETPEPLTVESPQRLISMVPSITEVLFDVGLGDRIVGDSKFTIYPPETQKIEKIGGLYDIEWEQIIALKPDLAVTSAENESVRQRFRDLRIETIAVDHRSLEGVLESYDLIGERFGGEIQEKAQQQKAVLRAKLNELEKKTANLPKVRVMLCLDRTRGSGRIQNLYIAGTNPFLQDVIRLAGGINVGAESGVPYPNVSAEGILLMNPEVIVDLLTGEGTVASANLTEEQKQIKILDSMNDWKTLGNLIEAVQSNRIFLLMDDYTTIPGPRTPLFVEQLIEIFHRGKRQATDDSQRERGIDNGQWTTDNDGESGGS